MGTEQLDRQLLAGVLAMQLGFINREQLMDAVQGWLADSAHPIEDRLFGDGALNEEDRDLLGHMVEIHAEKQGGHLNKSLTVLGSVDSVIEELRTVNESQIEATVAGLPDDRETREHLPTVTDDDDLKKMEVARNSGVDNTRFRLLRPHAKGGLGEVFVARDTELNREVALKEMQTKFADNLNSQSRFLLEAEVTGSLEHPGIVPVYGLGRYGDGRPYYAMRFIRGDSLEEAVDRLHHHGGSVAESSNPAFESVGFRKILGRFIDVCNAIEFAHSRGVLHRDLKPGNIMLGDHGETLVVDWGLAKVQGRDAVETCEDEAVFQPSSGSNIAQTQIGRAIGTPAFMPPEQASGKLDELGPASDVYSLGATLYYVLTGQRPIQSKGLENVLKDVQAGRFKSPRSLNSNIPMPLNAICLKAMSLRVQDRYNSPQSLADDIERFLADEPIIADVEPIRLRARRWMRKHPKSIAALAAGLFVGLASTVVIAVVVSGQKQTLAAAKTDLDTAFAQVSRSNEELKKANQAERIATENAEEKRVEAELAREEERIAKDLEAVRRKESEAVLAFFQDTVLAAARPESQNGGLGIAVTVRDAIDAAEPQIEFAFPGQPAIEASVRAAVGNTYHYLGEYPLAIQQLEQALELRKSALGDEHPETVLVMNDLAMNYQAEGRLKEARSLYEQTVELQNKLHGTTDIETLKSTNNLALAYQTAGRIDEAISMYEETLRLAKLHLDPSDPFMTTPMNNLATAYLTLGRVQEALPLLEETRGLMSERFGAEHPRTLSAMSNLAKAYGDAEKMSQAIPLFEQTVALMKEKLGADHPDTLTTMNNQAVAFYAAGRVEDALLSFEELLKQVTRAQGPTHPDTMLAMSNLAGAYHVAGRKEEALEMLGKTLQLAKETLGNSHAETIRLTRSLSSGYWMAGRFDEAGPLFKNCVDAYREAGLETTPQFEGLLAQAGDNALQQKQYATAESYLRECLTIRESSMPDSWHFFNTKRLLGGALLGRAKAMLATDEEGAQELFVDAERLLIEGYEGIKQREVNLPPTAEDCIVESLQLLVDLYSAWEKTEEKSKWQQLLDDVQN